MKISLNWVREFTDIKCSTEELVAKIGAQLGEVEEVVNLGERYENILIAKVVSCEKHPNADKLSVCLIDDGGKNKKVKRDKQGLVQVVCGAPNVRKNLVVAWIPPGAIVPSTYDKEQFKLEAREIRGQVSNGMLASGHELAINDDHEGVLEVDVNSKPGEPLTTAYQLDDHIIEVENKMFTHRPDCFGILGVAREISGIQNIPFKSPDWFTSPQLAVYSLTSDTLKLDVKNDIPDLVSRFMAVPLAGVKVAPSPIIMQTYLSRVGIKPINNVVDITNFVMYATAQPLHAYDADKLRAIGGRQADSISLGVRTARKNDQLRLLGGKEVTLGNDDAILITAGDVPVGIGGVIGGADAEVDADTTSIILECANFDMYNIRRTSMTYGLFTDAVTRFNKGQSPLQNDRVLACAVAMLQEHAHAHVAGKVIDTGLEYVKKHWPPVMVSSAFINARLGLDLSVTQTSKLLENVEFHVEHKENNDLRVFPPFWRMDVKIAEDVVEEIGRLYGYDHLPLQLPLRSLAPAPQNNFVAFKSRIRRTLSSAGANELLTYSFVHSDLMKKAGQNPDYAYQLSNALSPDLQYYRLSLLPSLLEKIHLNLRAGHNQFALFEMNPVHCKDFVGNDKLPAEDQRLAFVFAAEQKAALSYDGAPFYQAKHYLQTLLDSLGIVAVFEPADQHNPKHPLGQAAIAPFEKRRAAIVRTPDGTLLGELGEIRRIVRKRFKLPDFVAGFELDTSQLLALAQPVDYQVLSRFPSTDQDISFRLSAKTTYQQLYDVIESGLVAAAQKHGYTYQIAPIDIYQPDKSATHKHMALRIRLTHGSRTLTTTEVNHLLDGLAVQAKQKIKAARL